MRQTNVGLVLSANCDCRPHLDRFDLTSYPQEVSNIVGNVIGDSFNRTTDDLTGGTFDLSEHDETGVEKINHADHEPVIVDETGVKRESANESQSVKKFMQNVNRIRFHSQSGKSHLNTSRVKIVCGIG